MLIAWASLHRLDRIRRNVTSRPEQITLIFNDQAASSAKTWSIIIVITEGRQEDFVGYLLTQMTSMGVGVERVRKN
jgi:hypothetical protein